MAIYVSVTDTPNHGLCHRSTFRQAADLTGIMIELLGRGFATVAAVLSFIADNGTQ
jgi:hypothetical protein